MNEIATPKSRTARFYEELHGAIVDGRYPPGAKLRIDHLSREFAVSSGAVREALSRLTADGLVVAEPQKGFVVTPISRRDLKELTEVRVAVEGRCLAEAIKAGDLDWEGRVTSIQHRLGALGEAYREIGTPAARQWHRLHEEFHDELASGCRNGWWLRLRRQLYVQSERYRRLSGPADEFERNIVAEHAGIADATLARDTETAIRRLTEHLERTTAILLTSRMPFSDE